MFYKTTEAFETALFLCSTLNLTSNEINILC